MKQKTKILTAGAMAITGALTLGGLTGDVKAASVTTEDALKTCLESTTDTMCTLGGDITPTAGMHINVPATPAKTLDFNGHVIKQITVGTSTASISIASVGDLTIQDGASGTGGTYGGINVTGKLTIKGGNFYGNVSGTTGAGSAAANITILNGTFNQGVGSGNSGTFEISNGNFLGMVDSRGTTATTIKGGTYKDSVGFYGLGENQITGGDFNGTVYCGQENSNLTISNGSFKDMNCISYHTGSKLNIAGGTFTKGFSVGVETLRITGGKFQNGSETEGWLALILEHPDTQDFKITGGTFVNTADEYGTLMAIKTVNVPTEAEIRSIFAEGTVLNDKWIRLGTDTTGGGTWSYIMKEKTDGEEDEDLEEGVRVPNTGHNTKDDDGLSATSIITIIASVLASSFALGAALYFGLHKKVAFGKK